MNVAFSDFMVTFRLVLDILVVWGLIYSALRLVRNNSRTMQIAKGIFFIMVAKGLAVWLELNAVSYLIDTFLDWGVVAILIVFQPEIRGMLERVGKSTELFSSNLSTTELMDMISETVNACKEMSSTKTGALITIQQAQSLNDYVRTGIRMDSVVSRELLGTIFQYGTPMHDGAVIIQGNKIACAAAYFPPTTKDLPSKYGARHRAAVGISEITDSITIIVSEETGNISVAVNGQLTQYKPEGLQRYLTNVLLPQEPSATSNLFKPVRKVVQNVGLTKMKRSENVEADERVKPLEVVNMLEIQGGDRHGKSRQK